MEEEEERFLEEDDYNDPESVVFEDEDIEDNEEPGFDNPTISLFDNEERIKRRRRRRVLTVISIVLFKIPLMIFLSVKMVSLNSVRSFYFCNIISA